MDRHTVEAALDNGKLWAAMGNGRYWVLRRNGKTQLWKTRPNDYRIPVKAGLSSTGQVWHRSNVSASDRSADFLISDANPNEPRKPKSLFERIVAAPRKG